MDEMRARFDDFKKKFIVPAIVTHHSKNVSGNWIENSKEVTRSFDCTNVEEGRYLFGAFRAKDVMDYSFWGAGAELIYEEINSGIQISNVQFGSDCWISLTDSQYVMNCHGSHDLFGCIGLRNTEYCVFNKQYSKEDYETLVAKIKDQMMTLPYRDAKGRAYGYGEFYPFELSPFGYNETLAYEFFPVDKASALARGYPWKEMEAKSHQTSIKALALPDDATTVASTITEHIIECAHAGNCNQQCTTAFRILPEDLELYKASRFPLPRLCPNCRHFERMARRNPIKLWPRECMCDKTGHIHSGKCPNHFETSYAPERPETVYCENCYNAEMA